MARLQATIGSDVMIILEQLLRRNDRARFIELAIKSAVNNPDIRSLFAWKNKDKEVKKNTPSSKIQFDDGC